MTTMTSTDQILEKAAYDGTISLEDWANSLQEVLQRLHDIVHGEFLIPSLPLPPPISSSIDPEVVASTPPRIVTSSERDVPEGENENEPKPSSSSQKENVLDARSEMAAGRPPEASASQRTEEMPPPPIHTFELEAQPGTLPPDLLSSYQMSRRVLEEHFSASPPYTIQRLAELVLHPKRHYRFLPAYLRALDRVVSVSSPVSDFPLPTLQSSLNGGFLTNGEVQVNGVGTGIGVNEREGLGSDESLGGALLTPIPWLRNTNNVLTPTTASGAGAEGELHSESTETIEGPHGAGSIETVSVTVNGIPSAMNSSQTSSSPIASPTLSEQSDASSSSSASTEAHLREQGGVTQGELLRQEQEAGLVPVNPNGAPMIPRRTLIAGGAAAVGREAPTTSTTRASDASVDEEQPHARGPETIGMEDMGPQPAGSAVGGALLDMEAAVGRGRSKSPQPPPMDDTEQKDEEMEGMGEPGQPGQDPKDVEKEVEKLKEAMDREKEQEAKDDDGDVVVADADGQPVGTEEKNDHAGDVHGADAVDTTGL